MVEIFKLLKVVVELEEVRGMMEAFKSEFFEVFFFVNNVRKIILCNVDDNG